MRQSGSTVECRTCGGAVARTAKACPHCGERSFTRDLAVLNAVGAVGGLALLLACIVGAVLFADGCGNALLPLVDDLARAFASP